MNVRGETYETIDEYLGTFPSLKRKLASRGGIRREKLPLYLGEYVWRNNHQKERI